MFCIYLRTNSDLCHLHHKLTSFYNRVWKCLQRCTNWALKWSSLRFVFQGLNHYSPIFPYVTLALKFKKKKIHFAYSVNVFCMDQKMAIISLYLTTSCNRKGVLFIALSKFKSSYISKILIKVERINDVKLLYWKNVLYNISDYLGLSPSFHTLFWSHTYLTNSVKSQKNKHKILL